MSLSSDGGRRMPRTRRSLPPRCALSAPVRHQSLGSLHTFYDGWWGRAGAARWFCGQGVAGAAVMLRLGSWGPRDAPTSALKYSNAHMSSFGGVAGQLFSDVVVPVTPLRMCRSCRSVPYPVHSPAPVRYQSLGSLLSFHDGWWGRAGAGSAVRGAGALPVVLK
jgi:hypothetical protein